MSKLYKHALPIGVAFCLVLSLFLFLDCSLETAQSSKLKIGATYMTLNKSFFQVIDNEIKKEVEDKGDILYTRDPALDEHKQIEQIHDFINKGVDIIIVNPVNSQTIEPSLLEAKEKGIKIIVIDAPLEHENIADCTIVSDNYQAGVECAKDMMEKVKSANIVLLEHESVISGKDRIQGFKDTIQEKSTYRIIKELDCQGQTTMALGTMRNYLQTNRNFQVVMCLNDTAALGVLASLEEVEKEDVLVYGVDGAPDIKNLIASSKVMEGTASQSPIQMGKKAAYVAYRLYENKIVDEKIVIDTELITKENVSEYSLSGWQ